MRKYCKKCELLLLNDRERDDEMCRFCKHDQDEKQAASAFKRRFDFRYALTTDDKKLSKSA